MKTVLVTGAGGFTGRYLVRALRKRGYRTISLNYQQAENETTWNCDLTDAAAVRAAVQRAQPDKMVHLAASSHVKNGNVQGFYRVNFFGTLHLLEALEALEQVPDKVILASSANVYGTPAIDPIDEAVEPAPVNHYANSKLVMEQTARLWFDKLPIVITRPFNYTGLGQNEQFLIPKIVSHFRRQAPYIELGNLEVSRDFSAIQDVVACYLALLETDIRSEVVNICSGVATSLKQVIDLMNTLAGYTIEVRVNPDLIRTHEIPILRGDSTKLKGLIGFAPATSMEDILNSLYQSTSPCFE